MPPYIYGAPYLGTTAAVSQNAANLGTMQIPSATQLSHAAALAAATNQFYEYQVSSFSIFFIFLYGWWDFLGFLFSFFDILSILK